MHSASVNSYKFIDRCSYVFLKGLAAILFLIHPHSTDGGSLGVAIGFVEVE